MKKIKLNITKCHLNAYKVYKKYGFDIYCSTAVFSSFNNDDSFAGARGHYWNVRKSEEDEKIIVDIYNCKTYQYR